ncbi:MAG: electron transport complex subunit RsxC [Candidatus Pelagadaptatus aseana]|uniref:electron transport complex subunit RsxC n=1 Tax=Candidatus Pelagadaptatus aseana TaxID=3120508 RepID=UPI0039B26EED
MNTHQHNLIPVKEVKVWDIPGGVHPPENKHQSMQLPLGEISLPAEMIHPLSQHIGAPAEPIVAEGDHVLAGQKIAEAVGPFSAPIHASTSGTVSSITERTLPHPSGMSGECIVITPDGQDQFIDFSGTEDYLSLSHDELVAKIRDAGIAGMGGAGFPTAVKLNPKSVNRIDTLIINGTECEPYITADDMLMQTRADDVIKGTQLLAHIVGNPERLVIGIEDNKPEAISAVRQAAQGTNIEVAVFPTKYPSGGEKQLIQIITGQEVPSGDIPASIGIVVQNVGTTVAAYEAVRFGKPLIERITTVVGESLQTQRNIKVRLGTPISHILAEHGFNEKKASRVIMGGPMMGYTLANDQVPVVKTSNCLLAPTKKELPNPDFAQACIRCGMCAEACPAGLLPQQMYWYAQAEDYDRLQAHNLMDCIECGACSFVCPSSIPLVQYYRAAKGTIRQMAVEKEKSDRSRQRFEFRQERIAKAEAEKEAKRLARKQAAEAAKKKQAEAKAAGENSTNKADDLIAAALARTQSKQLSPEEQKARLERGVISAQSRVEKLREKLREADETMAAKLAAQVKQAEQKLADAEKKLADFKPDQTPAAAPAADADDPVARAIANAQAKMAMAPDEKIKASIESLHKRLAKAEEKLAAAKASGDATTDALQAGADKLKEKIATAEKELAELQTQAPAQPTAPEPQVQDAASAAIEKAKAKAAAMANMSDDDKLRAQVEALQGRLEKAQQRLQKAEAEGDDNVEAFRAAAEKMQAKLEEAKAKLPAQQAAESAPEPKAQDAVHSPEQTAAGAAIEKAKAKAAAMANMSEADKLKAQVESLQGRLEKAQQRLAKAEAEGDSNVDAFRTAAEKLQTKLEETQANLEQV